MAKRSLHTGTDGGNGLPDGIPGPAVADRSGLNGHTPKRKATPEPTGLATTCMTDINTEPLRWIVPAYVPEGKQVILAGDGGHGKSACLLDLAACLSRGQCAFGLEYPNPITADTLLISCEDDPADTIKPRLLAAGADMRKIHVVNGVALAGGKVGRFSLAAFQALEEELIERPEIKLVVIDPVAGFIGGRDDHKDSELRELLGPLGEVVARCHATVFLIKHLNKGDSRKAVERVGGSVAYINSVRAAYLVAPSEENEDDKLFLPLKFNICKKPPGLSYRLVGLDAMDRDRVIDSGHLEHLSPEDKDELAKQLFRVQWMGQTTVTADQALEKKKSGGTSGTAEQAAEWIEAYLEKGKYASPSDKLLDACKGAGFKFDATKRAREILKEKGGWRASKQGFNGKWWFGHGDPEGWVERPSTSSTSSTPSTSSPSSTSSPEGEPVCLPGPDQWFQGRGVEAVGVEEVEEVEEGEEVEEEYEEGDL